MSVDKKISMPALIKPMLCTLAAEPFTKDGWLYEVKWDGYRIVAYKKNKQVILRSRSGLDYSNRYTVVTNAIKKLKGDFIIDGEIVAFDEQGQISFDLVQKANPDAQLAYYVFDIIWQNGKDLTHVSLIERKKLLQSLVPKSGMIKFSDDFSDGVALYQQAQKLELEGIVAKKENSIYREGKRGDDWLKIPTVKRQEFVIGGWAESAKARAFRSLLFGAYNKKKQFEWIGRSGGGFKEKDMPDILNKLKALEIKDSPFINKVLDTKGATIHYVKPQLVANFKFSTWTESGRIRKPATFLGFRTDKSAQAVVREVPLSANAERTVIENVGDEKKPKPLKTSYNSNWLELDKIAVNNSENFIIDKYTIKLTNIERELWKGITKADLIMYYNSISAYILPHLKHRPLSLHIKPYAVTAPGLYIKDMEGRQPAFAEIFSTRRKHPKPGKRNTIDYVVCNNKATLLYLINLGCIDLNPWSSQTDDYLHPNYIVIDLDPSDEDFQKVISTATAARQFFDEHGLETFVKTSGKTGMHILIPCKGISFPQARKIAVSICNQIHQLVPQITTTTISVNQRGNKLYIDPSQNDEADTIACAYSCRPFALPTVSAPLKWSEVKSTLKPEAFTIETIQKRLEKKGNLFADILNPKVQMANSKRLQSFL